MSGTEDLLSKWTTQMTELQAEIEAMTPGEERDGLLHRIALLQRAIDMSERLLPTHRFPPHSPK